MVRSGTVGNRFTPGSLNCAESVRGNTGEWTPSRDNEASTKRLPGHDIIVIGASAGGVEALRSLVAGLPADLPASLFVVQHVPASHRSQLPAILGRSGPLPALHPAD